MKRGLVLGKFAPLHKGHQLLIERSLAECGETFVLVYDAPEVTRVPIGIRANWIRRLYPTAYVIEGPGAPGATGRTAEVMKMQEDYIRSMLPKPITDFFSSEWYGEHVSMALGARDVRVDETRSAVPVSGTKIRTDAWANRAWVAPLVYRDLVQPVVLLGAESTGKSTLAEMLAKEFSTVWVPELGRDYWIRHKRHDGTLGSEQLTELAQLHLASEEKARGDARRLLFVDTDARITRQYARWYHEGEVAAELNALAEAARARYPLAVLCSDDIAYVQDGTRVGDGRRRIAQDELRDELTASGVHWIEARGTIRERVNMVKEEIARLDLLSWR